MDKFEEYARDGENRFESVKKQALVANENGRMTKKVLEHVLERAFKAGHYTGHCRGEKCARESMKRIRKGGL